MPVTLEELLNNECMRRSVERDKAYQRLQAARESVLAAEELLQCPGDTDPEVCVVGNRIAHEHCNEAQAAYWRAEKAFELTHLRRETYLHK